jgi:predicted nucleic acid-binding protein
MNGTRRIAYLDASAIVKLLAPEPESVALRTRIAAWPQHASAAVARTEIVRALRRNRLHHRVGAARRLFSHLNLIRIDEPLCDAAGDLDPVSLSSLDALHLAAAAALGPELGVFVTYDRRVAQAAASAGFPVESPA